MLQVVECRSIDDNQRLVDYRLFSTIEKANKFLIWKANDVHSADLNLEAGTFSITGNWCKLRWTAEVPINTAKAILFKNQINYRETGGWLEVLQVFTVFGKRHEI